MKQTQQLLLDLIRFELTGNKSKTLPEKQLNKEQISLLLKLAQAQSVSAIVISALLKLNIVSDDMQEGVRQQLLLAVHRAQRLQLMQDKIAAVLSETGISFVPLKGAVLRDLYPEPWQRSSCDIDILVYEKDIDAAVTVLSEKLGFEKQGRNYHDISLFSKSGIHLELHFSLQENMENIDALLLKAWHYTIDADQTCSKRFTNEYLMFHILAHLYYHFLNGGCGVRPFIDLWILQNKLSFDDKLLRQMCETCKILVFYQHIRVMTDVWFGDETKDDVLTTLESFVLKGGSFGTVSNRAALSNVKNKQNGLSNSPIVWSYDVLKNKYPILQKHKWLLPLYQLLRFGKVFSPKAVRRFLKLRKLKNIAEKSPDTKYIEQITILFETLDIL